MPARPGSRYATHRLSFQGITWLMACMLRVIAGVKVSIVLDRHKRQALLVPNFTRAASKDDLQSSNLGCITLRMPVSRHL
jgi:hypothetical protein